MISALEMIQNHGDFYEQGMFADSAFACAFNSYPIIWRALVLPNRDPKNPTLSVPEWRDFSAHHYSAIVRCWNVQRAEQRIQSLCWGILENPRDGQLYLDLQEQYVSLFCSIGAAYDNLQAVFSDAQVAAPRAWEQKIGSSATQGSLRWFYDRRTQAVHKIVVPIFGVCDVPHLDMTAFSDVEGGWGEHNSVDVQCAADVFSCLCCKFNHEMEGAWTCLLSILQARHARLFEKVIEEDSVIEMPMSRGSGPGPGWRRGRY